MSEEIRAPGRRRGARCITVQSVIVQNIDLKTHNTKAVVVRMFLQVITSVPIRHIRHYNEGAVIKVIGAKEGCRQRTSAPSLRETRKVPT